MHDVALRHVSTVDWISDMLEFMLPESPPPPPSTSSASSVAPPEMDSASSSGLVAGQQASGLGSASADAQASGVDLLSSVPSSAPVPQSRQEPPKAMTQIFMNFYSSAIVHTAAHCDNSTITLSFGCLKFSCTILKGVSSQAYTLSARDLALHVGHERKFVTAPTYLLSVSFLLLSCPCFSFFACFWYHAHVFHQSLLCVEIVLVGLGAVRWHVLGRVNMNSRHSRSRLHLHLHLQRNRDL